MFEEYKGVYVIADCFDGQVRKVTYELIGQARLIADQLQEDVHTLLLGAKVAGEAQSLIEYGSDYVHVFEHPYWHATRLTATLKSLPISLLRINRMLSSSVLLTTVAIWHRVFPVV